MRAICPLGLLLLALMMVLPRSAAAQVTVSPTRAQFDRSPDHDAVNPDGTPVVQSYQLDVYVVGAAEPVQIIPLGKPNPDTSGTITVDLSSALVGWPVPGTNYVADVAAVGPGGLSSSGLSNIFAFCNYSLSPTSQNIQAAGGTGSTTVTTTSGCSWTTTSNATWITVTGGSSGTGTGTVSYTVAANTSSARAGTLTAATRLLTVTQNGTCTFSLSPTSHNVGAAGAPGSTSVTTASECAWTATSNAAWITVTGGSSGTGPGTVSYTVATNTATTARTGTLTVAGQTLTVMQSGACSFSVSPTSQSIGAAGGPGSTTVTTTSGCTWTATSNATWITVTGGSSGTGTGGVSYTVAANTATARTGTLTVAGQTVTVTQSGGAGAALSVSATSVAAGGSVTVTLTDGPGGALDWLALAATAAPTTSYFQYTYVGAGITTRTWTVTMPTTVGTYEFRLFLNNGFTSAATSPTVTVTGGNPPPILSSLSPTSKAVGSPAFILTVNGSGFVSTSTVRWNGANRITNFLGSTQLQAFILATDLTTVGTAQVTVFNPVPGGGTSSSLTFTITGNGPQPTLTVSATQVTAGASVTVTLNNGTGGALDWLSLAAANAANTSYIQYAYVGAGLTTRTWTVTMPTTPGQYEFRLFLNNGYTLAATSPRVHVRP